VTTTDTQRKARKLLPNHAIVSMRRTDLVPKAKRYTFRACGREVSNSNGKTTARNRATEVRQRYLGANIGVQTCRQLTIRATRRESLQIGKAESKCPSPRTRLNRGRDASIYIRPQVLPKIRRPTGTTNIVENRPA